MLAGLSATDKHLSVCRNPPGQPDTLRKQSEAHSVLKNIGEVLNISFPFCIIFL